MLEGLEEGEPREAIREQLHVGCRARDHRVFPRLDVVSTVVRRLDGYSMRKADEASDRVLGVRVEHPMIKD
ncbi:MAG: hypothetical protein ABWZ30_04120 [Jiangellaceae bacterium]